MSITGEHTEKCPSIYFRILNMQTGTQDLTTTKICFKTGAIFLYFLHHQSFTENYISEPRSLISHDGEIPG